MNPVSVKIGTHLDTYTAKVTLKYYGQYDETSMKILRDGDRLGEAFCATCEVFAYDLDEEGNPDNCYMFKKPTSYKYNAYPDKIKVEIEFGELHQGPNIDKKCKEIELLQYYTETLRKLMKEEFDKNSKKNEGDSNMNQKSFFECDTKTYADLRFRDWLNSSETAIFVTYLDDKYYSLELRAPASFDFHTVSDSCLKSLTAYTYEVSDKHRVPVNCHKLSSIKDFTCKREGYTCYRIILNFNEELENDDVKNHCGLKEFVDCISGQTTYTLDKERPDDIKGSDIIKHLTDNAAVIKTCAPNGQCLNTEFIRKNQIKGDDTMKHFSDCVGMCATCVSKGHCLAGIGDDDYVMADKAELIRRLKNDKLGEISIEEIKKVLKKEYGYDYDKEINNTKATTRISKPEYYLKIAEAVSLRGTCLRRKFGSIIVKDDRIVSTGYVGAPRGRINCCDRGTCYRMEHNVPSGQRYELCRSCHSEMNAVIQASPEEMKDATLYLVGLENDGSYTNADCCSMCKRVIINAGISTVVARQADCGFKTILVSDWIKNDDSLDIDHEGY
jgi:dCMP deaminase